MTEHVKDCSAARSGQRDLIRLLSLLPPLR
jgi:hypothetical protein